MGKKPSDSRQLNEYDRFRGLWQFHASKDVLEQHCRALCINQEIWNSAPNLLWIMCLSFLLECNREREARDVFDRYVSKYGCKDFHRSVRVAEYALQHGESNSAIISTVAVWHCLKENRAKEEFVNYVRGKRIAVVGNGGGELGLGKGAEIDSHDIVIRFNNYPLKGFEQDYGTKTDVWVRVGNNEVNLRDIAPYRFVIFEPDLSRSIPPKEVVTILRRYVAYYPQKILYLDTDFKTSMREDTGILNPSSGCMMVYWLHRILGSLEQVDLYGFAALSETKDYSHYYDDLSKMKSFHYPREEERLICSLLGIPSKVEKPCTLYVAAYRKVDFASGKTGGPGGVCALMRDLIGEQLSKAQVKYLFQEEAPERDVLALEASMPGKLKGILRGADFIFQQKDLRNSLDNNEDVRIVCHDIGTAYGAFLAGIPYVLVYHQQGSIAQEMESAGAPCPDDFKEVLKYIETAVFCHAYRVYFPSLGARDFFKKTSLMDKEALAAVPFSDTALYNTVHEKKKDDCPPSVDSLGQADGDGEDPLALMQLALQCYDEVFLSVGDFVQDKGMDRVPNFLGKYVERTGKKVAWIAIGVATDKSLYETLTSSANSWDFDAFFQGERIDHAILLQLLEVVDYFIMLHRNSIFDLAVLEAMRAGKRIILSRVGGNPEFNVEDNILLVDDDHMDAAVEEVSKRSGEAWESGNRKAFWQHFSPACFRERYEDMIREFLGDFEGISFT